MFYTGEPLTSGIITGNEVALRHWARMQAIGPRRARGFKAMSLVGWNRRDS
jgi:hypothetical protein